MNIISIQGPFTRLATGIKTKLIYCTVILISSKCKEVFVQKSAVILK
jgi:hypothetical protein